MSINFTRVERCPIDRYLMHIQMLRDFVNRCCPMGRDVTRRDMLKLLNDGYVRMTLPTFYTLRFRRHMCLQDKDLLEDLWREGIPAVNAGYYELVCDETELIVSVGCAWHITAVHRELKVEKDDVNSNVMLLDESGQDCGAEYSRVLIQNWLGVGERRRDIENAVTDEIKSGRETRS